MSDDQHDASKTETHDEGACPHASTYVDHFLGDTHCDDCGECLSRPRT